MKRFAIVTATALAAGLCAGTAGAEQLTIHGAGATFPAPLYTKWFDEYQKTRADVQFDYQPIGSGGGIRQVIEGAVDFGATDGPMSNEQLGLVKGRILHIPTVLGAVVPIFNVDGVTDLKLSGQVIARVFLGKITRWNDAAIASLNPEVRLPDAPITAVHRVDGSGTSFAFTQFLTKVSSEWARTVGSGTVVDWPVGLGVRGNLLVSQLVKQTPNSLGYAELAYALQNDISYAAVQNKDGRFVKADMDSIVAAASGVKMPQDFRVSIINAAGAGAYPIASFTWLLVYQQNTAPKGKALKDFLSWMLDSGQQMAPELHYAPLPKAVKTMVEQVVASIGDRAGS